MSLQLDLFTHRARLVSPDAPARSTPAGNVTVDQTPAGVEYLNPICGKCGGEKRYSPHAKRPHNMFRCQPCNSAERKAWRIRAGACRDRDPPHKREARAAVRTAIRTGRLLRGPCEVCGSAEAVQAHHDDYSRPLDVMWLCTTHHAARHRYLDSLQASPERA